MNGGKLVIETELKNNKLDNELAKLQRSFDAAARQSDVLANKIERLEKSLNSPRLSDNKMAQITSQIETAKLQLGKAIDRQDYYNEKIDETKLKMEELKNATQQTGNETNRLGTTNSKVFEKGVKTLKRFALGIIGIRSAYTMARRAASAYMAQDEELSNKVKSFWIGLGSFLAPILEMLSDVMLKALGYLNVFIKALTGVDYIARANAKALKKQADATKEATKALSSLDEIENIDLGSKTEGSSLSDFGYIDIPELDPKVVKKLEEMAGWLKENWEWISKVGEVLLLVFAGSIARNILKGIGKLIGSESLVEGLSGLKGLLAGIAVVWTITLVAKGLDDLKEWADQAKKAIDLNHEAQNLQKRSTTTAMQKVKEVIETYGEMNNASEEGRKKWEKVLSLIATEIDYSEQLSKNELYDSKTRQQAAEDAIKLREYLLKLQEAGYITTETLDDFTAANKMTSIELENLAKRSKLTKDQLNLLKQAVKDGTIALDNIANEDYRIQIKTDMDNEAINKLLGTIEALESATQSSAGIFKSINTIKLVMAKIRLKQIRGYAQGGLVTQPTQALIGEAGYPEYVVPEKSNYLSRLASNIIENMPAGGLSDDLLLELNRNITDLANRPIVINVDGKALAQATYQDFKNEENRLNSSTSVSIK